MKVCILFGIIAIICLVMAVLQCLHYAVTRVPFSFKAIPISFWIGLVFTTLLLLTA